MLASEAYLTHSQEVKRLIGLLLREIAIELNTAQVGGSITASAYDTGWVATLRDHHNPALLAFPETLEWLLARQNQAGSWGEPGPYGLLPTLSCLMALLKAPCPTDRIMHATAKAHTWLTRELTLWQVQKFEGVGFEVLAPTLLSELEKLGNCYSFEGKAALLKLYTEKLKTNGLEQVYRGKSNLIHSLEAFGSDLEFQRLKPLQGTDGGYGSSPAATAALLLNSPEWDTGAANWLKNLTQHPFEPLRGGVPTAYPIDVFEIAWVLINLKAGGFDCYKTQHSGVVQVLRDWLEKSLISGGASISASPQMPPDSDDTAMVIAAIHGYGGKASAASLLNFEREAHFACFEGERGESVSANANVLGAFLSLPGIERIQYQSQIRKAADYLITTMQEEGYWSDKWHISPYYPVYRAVSGLSNYSVRGVQAKLKQVGNWLLETQSVSAGGWGINGRCTLEETAYAILSLRALERGFQTSAETSRYEKAISRGQGYLWETLGEYYPDRLWEMPRLWRGKELYLPQRVVLSAALAALLP